MLFFFPLSSRYSWIEEPVDTPECYLVIESEDLTRKIGCLKLHCPTPARKDPAFHQTSPLHLVCLGYSTFSFLYPVFHFHLSVNNYCQPYRTGIRIELTMQSQLSGSHVFRLIYHLWVNRHLFLPHFTYLLHVCSFASTPSFKSNPPHLAALACSSEVSLDVSLTAQDFVMSPNSISTFCGHFISCMPRTSTTKDWFVCRAEMLDKVNVQINHYHSQTPSDDL